ncbi:MAG: hypothetical protein Q8P49_01075 [Candidatus Liptonbacteria bacterium]|nr:hypothetical protein [Candidatus Liptonbacteria bacterium]
MFNFLNKDRLPDEIKQSLLPDPEILKRQKAVFLAAYKQASGNVFPERRTTFMTKLATATLVIFAAATSMSAYADTTNVPVTSPLYQLKRLSETARITFTEQDDKPQLRAELAGRRTGEIDDLKEKKPESRLLPGLARDLHGEIDDSINGAEKRDLRDDKLNGFCIKLRAAITTSSAAIRDELSRHPGTLERFKNKCDDSKGSNKDDDKSSGTDKNMDKNKGSGIDKNNEGGDGADERKNAEDTTDDASGIKNNGTNSVGDDSGKNKELLELAPAARILLRGTHKDGSRLR